MSKPTQTVSTATDTPVWLPSEVFFVRRITLDPASEVGPQAELAMEAAAPFALEQVYYGYLAAPDRQTALIFATHRRIFPGDGWPDAPVVLPAFAALLGEPPPAPRVRLWHTGAGLVAAAWDGNGPLPALVLARQTEPAEEASARAALLEEVARRLGGRKAELEEFSGPVASASAKKGQGIELRLGVRGSDRSLVTTLVPAALEAMDVRDKAALTARRQVQRRNRLLWGALMASLAGIVLAIVLEGVILAGGVALRRWRTAQEQLADAVRKIETAQSLSTRIEEMAQRRLRPFEMIAVLNENRPPSIQFLRCVTSGQNTLEIEGQTNNASSVGAYETVLRGLPVLESVEIRDVRLREGTTTFQLAAVFKPGLGLQAETEVAP